MSWLQHLRVVHVVISTSTVTQQSQNIKYELHIHACLSHSAEHSVDVFIGGMKEVDGCAQMYNLTYTISWLSCWVVVGVEDADEGVVAGEMDLLDGGSSVDGGGLVDEVGLLGDADVNAWAVRAAG